MCRLRIKSPSLIGIIVLVIQLCGCATRQKLSDTNGTYTILWSGNNVRSIKCKSEKLPEGFLQVRFWRDTRWRKVLINSENQKVWARDAWIRLGVSYTGSGIVTSEDSTWVDPGDFETSDRIETYEWKLEASNILIYKETILSDVNGNLKHQEFFGPFGIALRKPK